MYAYRASIGMGLILLASNTISAAEAPQVVDLKDVLSVWQERAKQSQVVRYKWTETVTNHTSILPPDSIYSPAFVQMPVFKESSVSHDLECAYQLDRGSVWHQSSGLAWNNSCLRFLNTRRWTYYEEPTMLLVFSTPEETEILPGSAPTVAFIEECAYHDHEAKFQAGPILLVHHRATDKALGFVQHGEPQIVPGEETVEGHPCVHIKCGKYSYWTDVKNECLIRRYEWHRDDNPKPVFRVDLSYAENPQVGWVISQWTMEYSFGGHKGTSKSVVTAVEINGNPEPKEKLAALPVGTYVNDERGEGGLRYLVLPDQKRREITREDSLYGSPTYEELLHSEPGKAVPQQFIELAKQMKSIGQDGPEDRDRSLAVLKNYLIDRRILLRDVDLTRLVAHRLLNSKEPESAIRTCREFARTSEVLSRVFVPLADEFERELRFRRLPGSELLLTGTTLAGKPFDWPSYRGKVVLVDFWFTGCKGCVEAMPRIKEIYQQHRESGFDVIGISIDEDEEQLRKFLADSEINWTTIRETNGSRDSNQFRYNIGSFPTYILIDRKGKVVSTKGPIDQLEELIQAELKKE